MVIRIAHLREVTNRLFDYFEHQGITSVDVQQDYYWFIEQKEVYDPSLTRIEPSIGQLSDDWRELDSIRAGQRPPIGYAFVWLSAVLRAVGERIDK